MKKAKNNNLPASLEKILSHNAMLKIVCDRLQKENEP